MAKRKRTVGQIELDLLEIRRWSNQGKSTRAIAKIISAKRPYTLNHSQIAYDMKKVEEMWRENTVLDLDVEKGRILDELIMFKEQLNNAWEESKKDSFSKTEINSPQGRTTTTKTDKQTGDSKYIDGLLKSIDMRLKILGLYAPQKIAPTTPDGSESAPPSTIIVYEK